MEVVEVTAKRVEDALKDGLRQLSATIDDVDVKVIEAGGLFRNAKLVISLTEEVRAERERRAARDRRRDRDGRERDGRDRKGEREERRAERECRDRQEQGGFSVGKEQQRKEARPDNRADNRAENRGDNRDNRIDNRTDNRPDAKPAAKREQPQRQEPKNSATQKPAARQENAGREPNQKAAPDAPSEVPEKALGDTVTFLKNVIKKMGIDTEIATVAHGCDLDVTIDSDDAALIGYRGETLDSLEYLAGLIANRETEKYVRVSLDCNNYRDKRSDSLVKLAEKMAAKCIKTEHKVSLEPMNSVNRKIVHAALSDNDKVTTRSEGKEPNRRVVIYFKRGAKNEPANGDKRQDKGGEQNIRKRDDRQARPEQKPHRERETDEKTVNRAPDEAPEEKAQVLPEDKGTSETSVTPAQTDSVAEKPVDVGEAAAPENVEAAEKAENAETAKQPESEKPETPAENTEAETASENSVEETENVETESGAEE